MFIGPRDSSASLPFSLPAAGAGKLVDAKSDGAEVAAVLVAGGRGEEGRREMPCSLQAAGTGWKRRFSLGYLDN